MTLPLFTRKYYSTVSLVCNTPPSLKIFLVNIKSDVCMINSMTVSNVYYIYIYSKALKEIASDMYSLSFLVLGLPTN